ncbi:GTPase Era [bacterium]|nr:GTPase Era [bacterium]
MFKTAFISIIGFPNAGKSTLLNAILGDKLVITNKKAQTTRRRIKGILNEPGYQLVFSDTPGIIEHSAYLLQDQMMKAVHESLEDADVLVVLIDALSEDPWDSLKEIAKSAEQPVLIAINKTDKLKQNDVLLLIEKVHQEFESDKIIPLSALKSNNVDALVNEIKELAPEHPPFYDEDIISDENVRFLVSEMIREKLLQQFEKEIPYSAEVEINEYFEEDGIDKIYAIIYLERDSQKGIVIGTKGAAIKKLGTAARVDIEKFLGKKVFLDLSIKIRKNWRKEELQLKRFGYIKK